MQEDSGGGRPVDPGVEARASEHGEFHLVLPCLQAS